MSGRAGTRLTVVVFLLLAVAVGLSTAARPSSASTRQTCDPTYGCTTTSTPTTRLTVHCTATFSGSPGSPQTAVVDGVPPGADASIVFNGVTYGTGVADPHGHVVLHFQLPAGKTGTYQVVVAGADFSAACDPFVDAAVSASVATSPSGLLAHTGLGIGLLVLAALLLVLAGWALRRSRTTS
ncbi:MAG TPA: hypothetical protein VHA73_04525 [Acidimicrobiales bacterium]|nr:hypothetical protein [Acidimicrobiales bacterium]